MESNDNQSPSKSQDLFSKSEIKNVLKSDVAINCLLTRLKDSLLTCEELTKFIRKKYVLENDHTQELSKVYKNFFQCSDSSLQKSIQGILEFDGKLAKVKRSYVVALQKMYDELTALLLTMTKLRKNLKEHGRKLEKDVSDAIHSAEKAKLRYLSLCQDWEKLRLTDPTKTKLTLRGSKTTREQEEELQRKIDNSDLDYKQKVDHSTSLRNTFITNERPKIVSELKDLILEIDTAMSIQLQKYVIWTENLILNSGVTITPFDELGSMRKVSTSMTNEIDLYNYLNKYNQAKHGNFVNKNLIPVEYKKHPSMIKQGGVNNGKTAVFQNISSPSNLIVNPTNNSIPSRIVSTSNDSPFNTTRSNGHLLSSTTQTAVNMHTSNFNRTQNTLSSTSDTSENVTGSQKSIENIHNNSHNNNSSNDDSDNNDNDSDINNKKKNLGNVQHDNFSTLDPASSDFHGGIETSIVPSTIDRPVSIVQTNTSLPPGISQNFKTFGVPLEVLLEYEQDMVPGIVRQCIYVIDKYGLDLEGIYRKSANVVEVSRLKEEIDKDPSNISMILPSKNYTDSDIYLVGSLLKTFLANLPDSLLSSDMSSDIRTCLSISDLTTRKNFMHGLIYKLPDGQYWTLRSLIFHLKRVILHESKNRMNLRSMCIIWGPTIIAPNEEDINDVNYQINAMEVLFDVANQAFEPE